MVECNHNTAHQSEILGKFRLAHGTGRGVPNEPASDAGLRPESYEMSRIHCSHGRSWKIKTEDGVTIATLPIALDIKTNVELNDVFT